MDTGKLDFSYLIIQAFTRFDESYSKIKERYKGFPMCLMECIDKGERTEHIRVNFDKGGAQITYSFDTNRIPLYTCICFYEPSSVDLFLSYVKSLAESYDYLKKCWFITKNFYMVVDETESGIDFYCYRTVKPKCYG